MNIDEIDAMWQVDANMDKTELGDEALKVPKLHHKYYQIFVKERLIYRKYESELKKLKLEKYEFYSQGHTNETMEKGWVLPSKGLILKTEIPSYMDADPDLINMSLKIGYQLEKIEFLESILKTINNRGFLIKSAIDWQRLIMGS